MSMSVRQEPTLTPAGGGRLRQKIFGQAPNEPAATPRTGLSLLSNNAPKLSVATPDPVVGKAAPQEPTESAPPLDYDPPCEWEFLPEHDDWMSLLRCVAAYRPEEKENLPPPRCLGNESPRERDYDCLELDFDLDRIL